MQSKGWIRFVAILLALASIWQLSFTAVTAIQEKKAAKFAEQQAIAIQSTPEFAAIPEVDRAYYLDSIRKVQNRQKYLCLLRTTPNSTPQHCSTPADLSMPK